MWRCDCECSDCRARGMGESLYRKSLSGDGIAGKLQPMREVSLAILAGGRGTRMGGPKAELCIAGEAILSLLLSRLRWDGPTMLVTAADLANPPGHQQFTSVVTDAVPNQGPLRGVHTALKSATTDRVIVCTVDMPAVDRSQLEWLVTQLDARPDALAVMSSRQGSIIEPFPSILRASAATILRRRLAAEQLSVHSLRHDLRFVVVPAPSEWPQRMWTNLNTPADLESFLRSK